VLRVGASVDGQADGVLILGGVHPREWVPPDDEVRRVVDTLDVFFYPCVNRDGRHFSQSADALWRKNRRPDPRGGACVGVDLNRNVDFLWDHQAKFASNSGVSRIRRGARACE
jgi:hypothetical protein